MCEVVKALITETLLIQLSFIKIQQNLIFLPTYVLQVFATNLVNADTVAAMQLWLHRHLKALVR
jgi:tmRNA-binding protein